ncbi:hypothetical protein [Candidatus Frankia nodulisporulans]|uniref:hypothetical protein n=2 Tax=Candidatus Frankia nodulisporulans TaxID=2060052 RepID=UPI0013D7F94D|nr:hypothetical protein [Candidatus Frankia nodulisporulans]
MGRPVSLIVRPDGPSWSAWSPQCPGLAMVQPAAAELRDVLPEVLSWYFGEDTEIEFQVHHERELHGVVLRVAQDGQLYDRERLAVQFTDALEESGQLARVRSEPVSGGGEVTLVCALQSDRVSWLAAQMDDDDVLVALLPVAESILWAVPVGTGTGADRDDAIVALGAYPGETTLGEVASTFAGPRQHLRI